MSTKVVNEFWKIKLNDVFCQCFYSYVIFYFINEISVHGSSFFKKENMIKNTIETKLAFLIFVAVKLNMQLIIITILRIFYFNVLYLELELAAKNIKAPNWQFSKDHTVLYTYWRRISRTFIIYYYYQRWNTPLSNRMITLRWVSSLSQSRLGWVTFRKSISPIALSR